MNNENNLPEDLNNPPGLVGEVKNWIDETSVCYQPMFSLAAALTLCGCVMGRKLTTEYGDHTNLFCMGVGFTSSGKDYALKAIAKILDDAAASEWRLGQITSDSAIEYALTENPARVFLIDEAGHFFANVNDAAAHGSPAKTIKSALLELWSCAGGIWKGKQRAPQRGQAAKVAKIEHPHVCLLGMTQPQTFFDGMSKVELRDGWTARNLIFMSNTRPRPRFTKIQPVPTSIREMIMRWVGRGVMADDGSKVDTPTEIVVPIDDAAMEVFERFRDETFDKMEESDITGDESNYIYGKAVENAKRVALTIAGGVNYFAPRITEEIATYAVNLVDFLIGETIKAVRANVSENAIEKAKQRVLALILAAGADGVSKQELCRRTRWLSTDDRRDIMQDLEESGEIVSGLRKTATRPTVIYTTSALCKGSN